MASGAAHTAPHAAALARPPSQAFPAPLAMQLWGSTCFYLRPSVGVGLLLVPAVRGTCVYPCTPSTPRRCWSRAVHACMIACADGTRAPPAGRGGVVFSEGVPTQCSGAVCTWPVCSLRHSSTAAAAALGALVSPAAPAPCTSTHRDAMQHHHRVDHGRGWWRAIRHHL